MSTISVIVRISCEFEREFSGALLPPVCILEGNGAWKDTLQKTKPKNFCETRSSAILYQEPLEFTLQLDSGKPEDPAGHSQPRLPKGRLLRALLQDQGVWLQDPAVLDLPPPRDAFGLPLVHRRSLQRLPYLGQSALCKTFLF